MKKQLSALLAALVVAVSATPAMAGTFVCTIKGGTITITADSASEAKKHLERNGVSVGSCDKK